MNWMVARSSGRSKRIHAALSLPVCGELGIHFRRPTLTIARSRGMKGIDCRVCIQSASSRTHVGACGEVDDDRVQRRPRPWRIRHEDRSVVGFGVTLRPRIVRQIVGADENMSGALQMPRQHALADAWLDESGVGSKYGNKGSTPANGVA